MPSVWTGVLSRRYSGQGAKLTSDLHPVPRLRMSGAVFLVLLYVCMPWTGTTFSLKITPDVSRGGGPGYFLLCSVETHSARTVVTSLGQRDRNVFLTTEAIRCR